MSLDSSVDVRVAELVKQVCITHRCLFSLQLIVVVLECGSGEGDIHALYDCHQSAHAPCSASRKHLCIRR